MIWATVSSWSCFCWLYRASPPLDAKNIINLTLVLTIWWCPCVYKSFSHICEIFPLCQISPIVVAVQLLSRVGLFVTPWTVACQASLSFIISLSLLKLMSIKWCYLIISSSAALFPSCLQSFPASGSFSMSQLFSSGVQTVRVSASASAFPMTGLISFGIDWYISFRIPLEFQSKGLQESSPTKKHQFFSTQPSLWSNSHIHTWLLENP